MAILEDRYHETHRRAAALQAKLAALGNDDTDTSREEVTRVRGMLEQAEREKKAILHDIEEAEERLLD